MARSASFCLHAMCFLHTLTRSASFCLHTMCFLHTLTRSASFCLHTMCFLHTLTRSVSFCLHTMCFLHTLTMDARAGNAKHSTPISACGADTCVNGAACTAAAAAAAAWPLGAVSPSPVHNAGGAAATMTPEVMRPAPNSCSAEYLRASPQGVTKVKHISCRMHQSQSVSQSACEPTACIACKEPRTHVPPVAMSHAACKPRPGYCGSTQAKTHASSEAAVQWLISPCLLDNCREGQAPHQVCLAYDREQRT